MEDRSSGRFLLDFLIVYGAFTFSLNVLMKVSTQASDDACPNAYVLEN